MSNHCLIAEFSDRESFATALEVLERSDIPADSISLVTHADELPDTEASDVVDAHAASPPGEKTTAATTLAGGALGGALGTATLMGPLLVAGPIFGMAAGAVGGSLLSAVDSFGVDYEHGRRYESKVEQGSCLVIVTGDDIQLRNAQRVLQTCGPASLEEFRTE